MFLWEIFWIVFGSGQSDVFSGTSMTKCCAVKANIDSVDPNTKHGSSYPEIATFGLLELSNWMSVYKMFAFT